jgi:drug/metabolite transporter (DMT)-like permease
MSALQRSYLLLIGVAAIWGVAPPMIKHVLDFLPVDFFLAYRFLIAILFLIPFLLITEPRTWTVLGGLSAKDWVILTLSGLLAGVLQLGFLFWGLDLTSAIDGAVINSVSPVITAICGFIILKEKVTRHEIIGLLIAFSGSLLIVIEPVFQTGTSGSGNFFGNFLIFLGTLSWTAYVLLTKRYLNHKISPLLLTTFMFFVGAFVFSAIVISHPLSSHLILAQLPGLPLSAHLEVVFMGLISGGLAYWMFQQAQRYINASQASIFLYLSPVFSVPISFFWLGEPITVVLIVGCLIIAVGVAIAEISRKRLRHVR